MENKKKEISVVIPAFNEAQNLENLTFQLQNVFEKSKYKDLYEIVIINDGSTDNSEEIGKYICNKYRNLTFLNLKENISKAYSLDTGIYFSQGKIIATMDADLQYKPQDLVRMIDLIYLNKDIVNGKQKTLKLGNIYSHRDWGHARDYVEGMWLMLQQEKPDDYVLSTNKTTLVKDFIIKCFKYKNIELEWSGEGLDEKAINKETGEVVVEIDSKYFRPSEVEYLLGYAGKAEKQLGWVPKTGLDDLISDMFENGM